MPRKYDRATRDLREDRDRLVAALEAAELYLQWLPHAYAPPHALMLQIDKALNEPPDTAGEP